MTTRKEHLTAIANSIGLDYAIFAAFLEVESGGKAFNDDGKLIIQFEPHVFSRYLKEFKIPHRLDSTYNGTFRKYKITTADHIISNGVEGQAAEWKAFNTAFAIHKTAAMLSTSIGMSQVMGFNYSKLGYASVNEMWDHFKTGELAQINGMANFITNTRGLLNALKMRNWDEAARLYNGAGYKAGKYHIKLKKAWEKFSK